MKKTVYILLLVLVPAFTFARGVYQEPQDFIQETFQGKPPAPKVLWLDAEDKKALTKILGHAPTSLRIRYWLKDGRSAWIMEEVGKEELITLGVTAHQGKIETFKVLVYRESRGGEVRHEFFTKQFIGAGLRQSLKLDRDIQGITGATLSVRALTRVAEAVLYLHSKVKPKP